MEEIGTAVVRATSPGAATGIVSYLGASYRCALGRSGCRRDKREGDAATPIGTWPIRRILYRADKIGRPATRLPAAVIAVDDGWCDEPADANYNRHVRHPYPASAERLWREDGLYDVVAVLGHNDDPVVPGAGSAIFMHVASPDYGATAGCIALRRDDLMALLVAPGLTAIRVEE